MRTFKSKSQSIFQSLNTQKRNVLGVVLWCEWVGHSALTDAHRKDGAQSAGTKTVVVWMKRAWTFWVWTRIQDEVVMERALLGVHGDWGCFRGHCGSTETPSTKRTSGSLCLRRTALLFILFLRLRLLVLGVLAAVLFLLFDDAVDLLLIELLNQRRDFGAAQVQQ